MFKFMGRLLSFGSRHAVLKSPVLSHAVAGEAVHENSALHVSAFYRGLQYVSTQLAKLPIVIKDDNLKVQDIPLAHLLNGKVNTDMMTAFRFWSLMIKNAILFGNGYAEIQRNGYGDVIALWPIDPNLIALKRNGEGQLYYEFDGKTVINPEKIFHLSNLLTDDGIGGLGLVEYADKVLGGSLASMTLSNALFKNGGLPIGVLTVDGSLTDEARARLQEEWQSFHGRANAGKIAILSHGAKFASSSLTPEMLQFIDTRKFSVIEIARFFGIHPVKLYDTGVSTYNNIEHAQLDAIIDTFDPWARAIEDEINVKLLNNGEDGLHASLDMFELQRGDSNSRANYYKTMASIGAMSANEARQRDGMPAYDGGDRYYIQTNNNTPSDRVDEVIDSQLKNEAQQIENVEKEKEKDEELTRMLLRNL